MKELSLHYPHQKPSLEPKRMRAGEIWRTAECARQQILPYPRRPKVDIGLLAVRCRRMQVNGVSLEICWKFDETVTDADGVPVLGATEYDASCPDTAVIYVNRSLMGHAEEIVRSTAIHELGHAVFDAPSWLAHASNNEGSGPEPTRRAQLTNQCSSERAAHGVDWAEWRANEFMGAFLLPPSLLHQNAVKRALSHQVPLLAVGRGGDLPILADMPFQPHALDALVFELSELFGVSASFVEVRLRKYGLIHKGKVA